MNTQQRRFVFIDFDDLKKIKFKKLGRVCEKLFVFVNTTKDKQIDVSIIRQIQKLGNAVKWKPISNLDHGDINLHICYLLGNMHNKTPKNIEFAILSNNIIFDSLINQISNSGRSCVRIKSTMKRRVEPKIQSIRPIINGVVEGTLSQGEETPPYIHELAEYDKKLVEDVTVETLSLLKRMGSRRPKQLQSLKELILLYNQENTTSSNIDQIVNSLTETNKVIISQGLVEYAL